VKLFNFVKQVFSEFGKDKGGTLSAAFAYFAIFAIAPLLLILISIVGFIFGEKAAGGQLFSQLSDVVGADAATTIQNAVLHIHESGEGAVALIAGAIGTVLAAIGLSNQLQNSFNTIFDAVPDPKSSLKRTVYAKVKNLILLASAGVVLIVSVVLSTIVSAVGDRLNERFSVPPFAIESLNTAVALLISIVILYLIYKVLPDVFIPRKVILSAAIIISLLFVVGKVILGIIIGRNATASAYGAAASLIVLLLWFYYTAQILLLGAEGIKVYGDNHALVYKAKKYTLKRRSFNVDLKDDVIGQSLEKFAQGYKKQSKPSKSKK
jgi:membrane protein